MLNSRVSYCRNAVPTIRRGVHRIHTHSVHDVHTAYSQARTNVNACLWLKWWWLSCIIFVRLKESIFRSAMSHPCWSFPHLLTSSPPHAAVSGPRDLLQDNTVHRQPLPQEPLQPLPEQLPHEPFPANAIRSENNAKESLSDPEYESAGNLRINTNLSLLVRLRLGPTKEESNAHLSRGRAPRNVRDHSLVAVLQNVEWKWLR